MKKPIKQLGPKDVYDILDACVRGGGRAHYIECQSRGVLYEWNFVEELKRNKRNKL